MFVKVREEFRAMMPSAARLRDEWPAFRDAVLLHAEKQVVRSRSLELSSLLNSANDDHFDEG